MPIGLNKILPKRDGDEGRGGGNERRRGINLHSILPHRSESTGEKSGSGLAAFLNPANRRAQRAAEQQKLNELRTADEQRNREQTAQARGVIAGLRGQRQDLNDVPQVRAGIRKALARVARENPEEALRLARMLQAETRDRNNFAMRERDKDRQNAAKREEVLNQLRSKPITTTRVNLGGSKFFQPDNRDGTATRALKGVTRGILGGVSAAATIAIRSSVAAASGSKTRNAFDQVIADHTGIHVDSPFSDVTHRDIDSKTIGEHDIVSNPPAYLDGLVGVLSALPFLNREIVSGWVPWGTLEVVDRRSNKSLVSAPTLFPGRKEQRLKKAMKIVMPNFKELPPFVVEPELADLLGDAAEALYPEDEAYGLGS